MVAGAKTVFVCGECGYESSKWLGRCPNCESWNTFVESAPVQQIKRAYRHSVRPLREVQADAARRIPSGIGELTGAWRRQGRQRGAAGGGPA